MRFVASAGILLPLLLAAGCRAAEPLETVVDLVEELPFAQVRCEPTTVDLGTPQGRNHLIRGWYEDERSGRTGRSFVWSRGDRSEIEFHLGRQRPLSVTVAVSPFAAPGLPDQELRVLLNEHEVARIRLRRGWQEATFELSTDALHEGANRLVLIPDHVWVPAEVREGSDDRRRLAVALDTIFFAGTEGATGVSVGADQTLSIPAGCVVDWYLDPPAGGSLMLAGILLEGSADLGLEITLRRDRHADVPLESVRRGRGSVRLDLPQQKGPLGLRFEAVTEGAADPGRRVSIDRPQVVAARTLAVRSPPPTLEAPAEASTGARRPNVIIYLVDALRADHLGCYGSDRLVSPRIDEFAAEATVFEDAVAQSSWTKAAVASIFTGVWPPAHGVHGPHDRLPEDLPTMPELLRDSGYRTAAVVANAYVGRSFGFDRGFEHFEFLKHTVGDSSVIHSRLTGWLDQVPPAESFFLYVHTVDPHAPYAPPEEFRHRFADEVGSPEIGGVSTVRALARGEQSASRQMTDDLRALYEAEIAFNDFNFGELVRELRQRGLFDDSLIIFVSDHGEAFGEHGAWTHGLDLHDEALRVPLVIRFPDGRHGGLRVPLTVQQADLLPTVLAAAGLTPPDGLDGDDLSAFVDRPVDRALFCYLDYWGRRGAATLFGRWKLIRPLSEDFGPGAQLYDRTSDPHEHHNLAAELPIRTGLLDTLLRRNLARRRTTIEVEIDARTRSELEALGYIE
jgi:arylsulfatase A-like enzyme